MNHIFEIAPGYTTLFERGRLPSYSVRVRIPHPWWYLAASTHTDFVAFFATTRRLSDQWRNEQAYLPLLPSPSFTSKICSTHERGATPAEKAHFLFGTSWINVWTQGRIGTWPRHLFVPHRRYNYRPGYWELDIDKLEQATPAMVARWTRRTRKLNVKNFLQPTDHDKIYRYDRTT